MSNPPQLPSDGAPPKKRGCFFYGCLTLLILVVLVAGLAFLSYRYVVSTVDSFTDTRPTPMEMTESTDAELDAIRQRAEKFGKALESQETVEEFVITAREINALISNSPDYREAKGKLFVLIEGGQIKGKVSIPLTEDIGPIKTKGRYLNGMATFRVALTNGTPLLKIDNLEVKGKPLPAVILNEMKKQNFADGFKNDAQASNNLAKIDTLVVKDDKIIVRNKLKP